MDAVKGKSVAAINRFQDIVYCFEILLQQDAHLRSVYYCI
jgi:hypothetical protein